MATNDKGYNFKILNEDVANCDLFEDQTHERVSKNLFKIIQSSEKGVTIGLEGAWGAGKSTVIKLLKDKFKEQENEKILFFMFDAWAHDGDPLRRIFLESFIREIDPEEKNEDLKVIKEKITGRKKIVEVKARKSTSRLGKYLSLSALLIPLGSAFLGKVTYGSLVSPWSEGASQINLLFFLGLNFCLAPLWILIFWCFKGDRDLNKKISWEFFTTDTREDYTQDITEDGERTSIEFEEHFKSIIEKSIESGLIDKCIVVIDNLDRITPEHAKNIWSTLQTFFQRRSSADGKPSWADKLWFLIPFDHQGFLNIWEHSNNGNVGSSFLKKCFQLIAEVPMPVMSGWAKYANAVIRDGLSDWPSFELEKAVEIYIRYAGKLEQSPTPRDMKVFANQLGLLGSMWGANISVESMCLYVLIKEKLNSNEIRQALIDGTLLNLYQTDNSEQQLLSEIAGLLFGVESSKGIQLLLGPEIQSAFREGDGEKLYQLSIQHPEAFWIVYQATRIAWLPTREHTDEIKVNFVKALNDGLRSYPYKIYRDLIKISDVVVESLPIFNISKVNVSSTIKVVSELLPDKTNFISRVSNWLDSMFETVVSEAGTDKFNLEKVRNVYNVKSVLSFEGVVQKRVTYNKFTSVSWKSWIDSLDEADIVFSNILPPRKVISEIANEVGFSSASLDLESLEYLSRAFSLYNEASEWTEISKQICSWLKFPNRQTQCETAYVIALKMFAFGNVKTKETIVECVKSPEFWVAAASSAIDENPSLPILAAVMFNSNLQDNPLVSTNVKHFWQEEYSESDKELVFERIKDIGEAGIIWRLCNNALNSRAIGFIKKTDDELYFSESAGANWIDDLKWASHEEIHRFAESLIKCGSFDSNKPNMIGKQETYSDVYRIFYAVNDPVVNDFIDQEILALDKDRWLNIIKLNSPLLTLVKRKNVAFTEAFVIYLKKVIDGDLNEREQLITAAMISSLLEKTADLDRKVAPVLSERYFSTEQDNISDEQFDALEVYFRKNLNIISEIKLMDKLNQWIDNVDENKINWLLNQSFTVPEEPLESLVSRVKNNLHSDSEVLRNISENIKRKFKFKDIENVDRDIQS